MVGIYCIRNLLNDKRYVGKSKDIAKRFWSHKNSLKLYKENPEKQKRRVNRHLANSVMKYGIENFAFEILQEFESIDEIALADAEIYWMEYYNTTDRDYGYNLMKDSSQNVIVHPETLALLAENNKGESNPNFGNYWSDAMKSSMSTLKKQQVADGIYDFMKTPEWKEKLSEWGKETWKDEDKKAIMARKVAEATSTLRFEQYDKTTGELVGEYYSMLEIMDKYPDFHKIAVYSVCNGWKKSYRGFVWKSFYKISEAEETTENSDLDLFVEAV